MFFWYLDKIKIRCLSLIHCRPFWRGRVLDWAVWHHVQKATKNFKRGEPTYWSGDLCLKIYGIKRVLRNSDLRTNIFNNKVIWNETSAWEKWQYSTSSHNWISKYHKSLKNLIKKSIWTLQWEQCTAYNTSVSKVKIFQFAFQGFANNKFVAGCSYPHRLANSFYFAEIV